MNLTVLVKNTLKAYGKEAGAHFGVKQGTLEGYMKRGKYPTKLIQQILDEQKEPGALPQLGELPPPEQGPGPMPIEFGPPPPQETVEPPPRTVPPLVAARRALEEPAPTPVELRHVQTRLDDIVKYLQGTVDFYIKQFNTHLRTIDYQIALLRTEQMRAAGFPSLARPADHAPVQQTFTTNPFGAPVDTGIAPTAEQVAAQAFRPVEPGGVEVRGTQLAHPAEQIPNQPSFGFGWNQPRSRR